MLHFLLPDLLSLDKEYFWDITNHPVHIVQPDNNISAPSAFIPFCAFGGDWKLLGKKIDQVAVQHVCTSFKPTIYQDQRCYQINLEKYKNINKIEEQLEEGLELILDYNEERQHDKVDSSSFKIYLDSISMRVFLNLPRRAFNNVKPKDWYFVLDYV